MDSKGRTSSCRDDVTANVMKTNDKGSTESYYTLWNENCRKLEHGLWNGNEPCLFEYHLHPLISMSQHINNYQFILINMISKAT